jgi:hypothetical protein
MCSSEHGAYGIFRISLQVNGLLQQLFLVGVIAAQAIAEH